MLTTDTFLRLCRARDRLRLVDDRPLTIDGVAREAAMSPFHFIRLFTALFGATPHQMRIQARLDHVKTRLILSDAAVTDLCFEVGCSSLGSFSDLFAKRVGASPSAYRRRLRPMVVVPGTLPKALTPGCLTLMGAAFATFEKQSSVVSGKVTA